MDASHPPEGPHPEVQTSSDGGQAEACGSDQDAVHARALLGPRALCWMCEVDINGTLTRWLGDDGPGGPHLWAGLLQCSHQKAGAEVNSDHET